MNTLIKPGNTAARRILSKPSKKPMEASAREAAVPDASADTFAFSEEDKGSKGRISRIAKSVVTTGAAVAAAVGGSTLGTMGGVVGALSMAPLAAVALGLGGLLASGTGNEAKGLPTILLGTTLAVGGAIAFGAMGGPLVGAAAAMTAGVSAAFLASTAMER